MLDAKFTHCFAPQIDQILLDVNNHTPKSIINKGEAIKLEDPPSMMAATRHPRAMMGEKISAINDGGYKTSAGNDGGKNLRHQRWRLQDIRGQRWGKKSPPSTMAATEHPPARMRVKISAINDGGYRTSAGNDGGKNLRLQ
jgi:hypothetical protein